MYQLVKKKRSPFVNLLLFLLALSITTEVLKLIFQPPPFNDQLMDIAKQVNKKCPIMVDSTTRLDNIMAAPGNEFMYNYTFVKINKQDVDTVAFKKEERQELINKIKTNPSLAAFKDNNVTIKATFSDDSGIYVCRVVVLPDEYK